MEGLYPLTSAIILNDASFVSYGGHTGNSTAAQRNMAYLLSEIAATKDLDTFLLPVIITGTYVFTNHILQHGLLLDYGYIHQVYVTNFIDFDETVYWSQAGTGNDYVAIQNDTFGILDINYILSSCNCATASRPLPYKVQVVYKSGFPTGTSTRPDVLMALTTYADLMLQEMIGYGNEAPGDIGVQEYANQEYREKRIGLLRTSFGTSARANLAHRLLTGLRKYRWCGL
jgi:hypothetical protein